MTQVLKSVLAGAGVTVKDPKVLKQVEGDLAAAGVSLEAIALAQPSEVATENAVGHRLATAATGGSFEFTFNPSGKALEVWSSEAVVKAKVESLGLGFKVSLDW